MASMSYAKRHVLYARCMRASRFPRMMQIGATREEIRENTLASGVSRDDVVPAHVPPANTWSIIDRCQNRRREYKYGECTLLIRRSVCFSHLANSPHLLLRRIWIIIFRENLGTMWYIDLFVSYKHFYLEDYIGNGTAFRYCLCYVYTRSRIDYTEVDSLALLKES